MGLKYVEVQWFWQQSKSLEPSTGIPTIHRLSARLCRKTNMARECPAFQTRFKMVFRWKLRLPHFAAIKYVIFSISQACDGMANPLFKLSKVDWGDAVLNFKYSFQLAQPAPFLLGLEDRRWAGRCQPGCGSKFRTRCGTNRFWHLFLMVSSACCSFL